LLAVVVIKVMVAVLAVLRLHITHIFQPEHTRLPSALAVLRVLTVVIL
jgi:hypothetical protein